MKVSIIGGAGVRVPLLVRGLVHSDLGIDEIALFDVDRVRLEIIAGIARRAADGAVVSSHDRPEPCVEGAAFDITSIRVGGVAGRERDEATAIAHGVVGQETVGPAGMAMALRAIPPMIEYARIVSRLAPSAWLINFTNPVSIVTQAVTGESGARVIGICDTPFEVCEDAAHALNVPATECAYDYFGLNHLGWLREVYHHGVPQLHRLWDDPVRLASVYRDQLFEIDRLQNLRLLPTEYLYYYYRPETALDHMRRAAANRGAIVARLTEALFSDLARGVADPLSRYDEYLSARDATYLQAETGSTAPRVKPPWAALSGYDRIALMTMRAIAGDLGDVIPLNVRNRGTVSFLADEDVIEVPCALDRHGPRAQRVETVPEHCRALMTQVKEYERATVVAALSGSRDDRLRALGLNPLAGPQDRQPALADALVPS